MSLTSAERAICARIAAEITAYPQRWTQGATARAADGTPVSADDSRAVCWCALGFLRRETNYGSHVLKMRVAFGDITGKGIATFNDRTGRSASEVAAVFAKLAQEPQA